MASVVQSFTRVKIGVYSPTSKTTTWSIIKAEEVSEGDSQDSEKIFISEQAEAAQVSFGQCEYSIELKGVLPTHKKYFRWLRERQIKNTLYLPSFVIYGKEGGTWKLQSYYKGVIIGDIDRSNSKPFDVKMEAISQLYRNANNDIV